MKNDKKILRDNFKTDVFERDKFTCKGCGFIGDDTTLDAHHIIDRHEIVNGGYVKENGITLCKETCHALAEKYHMTHGTEWVVGYHPDELFELIGSSVELAIEKSNLIKNK